MDLCFYFDPRSRDHWAHLVVTYAVPCVYEVGCPEGETTAKWVSVDSIDDIPSPRIFLSPQNAKYSPGTALFSATVIPDDAVLIFGSDDIHNTFTLRDGDLILYLDTPGSTPLHAVQAAVLVLQDLYTRG